METEPKGITVDPNTVLVVELVGKLEHASQQEANTRKIKGRSFCWYSDMPDHKAIVWEKGWAVKALRTSRIGLIDDLVALGYSDIVQSILDKH